MTDEKTSIFFTSPAIIKLLDQVQQRLRVKHYTLRTEQSYLAWIRNYILFHNKRHPAEMAAGEIELFLWYLAVDRAVSPATQNQALAALLFLYKDVLLIDSPWLDDIIRAVQELLDHADVKTTQIYTHVLNRGAGV